MFAPAVYVLAELRFCRADVFGGFKNKVTLGEDFRKPA